MRDIIQVVAKSAGATGKGATSVLCVASEFAERSDVPQSKLEEFIRDLRAV